MCYFSASVLHLRVVWLSKTWLFIVFMLCACCLGQIKNILLLLVTMIFYVCIIFDYLVIYNHYIYICSHIVLSVSEQV